MTMPVRSKAGIMQLHLTIIGYNFCIAYKNLIHVREKKKTMKFRFSCLAEKATIYRKQTTSLRNTVLNHKLN